jgi:hypothetical protein
VGAATTGTAFVATALTEAALTAGAFTGEALLALLGVEDFAGVLVGMGVFVALFFAIAHLTLFFSSTLSA